MRVGEIPWKAKPRLLDWNQKACMYKNCIGCYAPNSSCPLFNSKLKCKKDDFVCILNHGDAIHRYGDVIIVEFTDFHGNDINFIPIKIHRIYDINDVEYVLKIKEHMRVFVDETLILHAFNLTRDNQFIFDYTIPSSPEELARSEKKRTWNKRTREEIVEPLLKRMRPALPRDVREMIADKVFN